MGKIEVSQLPSLASGSHRQRKRATHVTAAATVIFLLWTWWAICREDSTAELGVAPASAATSNNELTTDWNLIEPSEDLHWVPCFRATDEFYCSRLTVPLDYNRPLHSSSTLLRPSPKVHIALVMLPGRNHSESGAWSESPLLVNPGGPGGSGTTLVLLAGRAHQEVAGADLDIIGFDPRGIGATTPKADCFSDMSGEAQAGPPQPGSLLRRVLWMSENAVVGLPNTSSTATEQVVFRQRGLTRLCNPQDYPDSILRYAGTPNVATDMLSIVQAWEKWTASLPQGSGLAREDGHAVDVGEVASPETAQPDPAKNETPPPSTRGKLVYWGFR
jgi:pimeloyl-ACP methyl ester carboxylesterase